VSDRRLVVWLKVMTARGLGVAARFGPVALDLDDPGGLLPDRRVAWIGRRKAALAALVAGALPPDPADWSPVWLEHLAEREAMMMTTRDAAIADVRVVWARWRVETEAARVRRCAARPSEGREAMTVRTATSVR